MRVFFRPSEGYALKTVKEQSERPGVDFYAFFDKKGNGVFRPETKFMRPLCAFAKCSILLHVAGLMDWKAGVFRHR